MKDKLLEKYMHERIESMLSNIYDNLDYVYANADYRMLMRNAVTLADIERKIVAMAMECAENGIDLDSNC